MRKAAKRLKVEEEAAVEPIIGLSIGLPPKKRTMSTRSSPLKERPLTPKERHRKKFKHMDMSSEKKKVQEMNVSVEERLMKIYERRETNVDNPFDSFLVKKTATIPSNGGMKY